MIPVRARSEMLHQSFRLAGVLLVCLLNACVMVPFEGHSTQQPKPEPVADEPQPVNQGLQSKTDQVAIILSQDIPEFISIADELSQRMDAGRYTVHHLKGRAHYGRRVMQELDAAGADQVIAVGLLAARIAHQGHVRPIVFCQAYNYSQYNLISDKSKGVSLLPPFDQQFAAWRQLSPELQRVGVVSGPDQAEMLQQITAAAEAQGIKVISRTVSSDMEALLESRRLVAEIEGLMLLPDNRVLSPNVLKQIMALTSNRRTQVAVYSSQLLEMGALISFSGSPDDVANNVISRLNNINKQGVVKGPDLQPLTALEVQVNPAVADQLSLVVPEKFSALTGGDQ